MAGTVIKSNYLFPIYCPDADASQNFEEKNFYATGDDIIATVAGDDAYVKKTGDSMSGILTMNTGAYVITDVIDTNAAEFSLNVNGTQHLLLTSSSNVSLQPLAVDQIGGLSGNTVSFAGNRLTNLVDPSDQQDAVTKQHLDDEITTIQLEITELEEEIDAIAPSIERGVWKMGVGSVPSVNRFNLLTGTNAGQTDFTVVDVIKISPTDNDGNTHSFATAEPLQLIQILNQDDDGMGLYQIDSVSDNTGASTPHYEFGVTFISSYTPSATAQDALSRIKIFDAPVAGNAVDFVLKSGDTMTGQLTQERAEGDKAEFNLYGNRDSSSQIAIIRFKNQNANKGDDGYLAYHSYLTSDNYFEINRETRFSENITLGSTSSYTSDVTISDDKDIPHKKYVDTTSLSRIGSDTIQTSSLGDVTYTFVGDGTKSLKFVPQVADDKIGFWTSSGNAAVYATGNKIQIDGMLFVKDEINIDKKLYVSATDDSRLYARQTSSSSINSTGSAGQVLTSNGSDAPPYWSSGGTTYTISKDGGGYFITP